VGPSTRSSNWPATRCRSAAGPPYATTTPSSRGVAEAEARLHSARAFLYQSLEEIIGEVARAGHITIEQRMVIRLASNFAIHQSLQIVDTAYHAAGSTAIFEENPFERRFRDIHTRLSQAETAAAMLSSPLICR
jgi:alkylation response protein AidB-like acyl-CoA dehydrogenase